MTRLLTAPAREAALIDGFPALLRMKITVMLENARVAAFKAGYEAGFRVSHKAGYKAGHKTGKKIGYKAGNGDAVRRTLKIVAPDTNGVARIKRAVADRYGVTVDLLASDRRHLAASRPRQIAFSLCQEIERLSLPQIGRHFGGRHHTTVMHGIRLIADLAARDPGLDADIAALRRALGAQRAA